LDAIQPTDKTEALPYYKEFVIPHLLLVYDIKSLVINLITVTLITTTTTTTTTTTAVPAVIQFL
jgi:hypothetical protein